MAKKWARWLAAVLALILLVSGAMMFRQYLEDKSAGQDCQTAREISGVVLPSAPAGPVSPPPPDGADGQSPPETEQPMDEYAAALAEIDFAALREQNSDVVGWLYIQDSGMSYPLMQAADNSYYLSHSWNNEKNSSGAIFLECQVDPGFGDFNTIIYGHNMLNGSMFSDLDCFAEQAYWEQHPSVYIAAGGWVRRYDIYAAWEAGLTDTPYRLKVTRPEDKQALIEEGLARSAIETGIFPTGDDRILTLSTCTDRGHSTRWVVQAVLRWSSET